jgi:hypothetical protein
MPKLSAPTQIVFLISLALVLLAVIGLFVTIPFISMYAFWVAIAGYVVLAAGCVLKGV